MKTKQIYNKLKNNLEYLIIRNNNINKSSFSMDIKVGTFDEDANTLGFAHLIEHLIFNSKKQNKFLDLINKAQGSFNAKTSYEFTNYRFDCDSYFFIEILNIFVDFIIKPIFTLNKINNELKVINSEFNKEAYLEEYFLFLNTKIKNKFNSDVNLKYLVQFYKKYYNSSNIKIAIQSNLNLKIIESFVVSKFSCIKKGAYNNNIFKVKSLKHKTHIDSDKNLLKLYFFLGNVHPLIDAKPNWFIKDFISSKHSGSLFSFLKEEIYEINTTVDIYSKFSILCVEFYLIQSNKLVYNKILNVFYSFIEFLKKTKFPTYYYKEQKIISKIKLNSILNQEGSNFISFYSRNMFNYNSKTINKKVFLVNKFSTSAYKTLLNFINYKNSSILLFSKYDKNNLNKNFLLDTYYKNKYKKLILEPKLLELKFKFNSKNKYIPKELNFYQKNNIKYPHKILDDTSGTVWFLNDYKLKTYEAYINFDIVTLLVNSSPKNKLLSIYYNFMVLESLEQYREEFSAANINFGIERTDRAYSVFIVGFSSNIIKAANTIINAFLLKKIILEFMFFQVANNLKNIYKDLENLTPYETAKYELNNLLHSYNIHRRYYKNIELEFSDFKKFFKEVFKKINLEFYVFGNIDTQSILKFYKNVYKKFNAKNLNKVLDKNDIKAPNKNYVFNFKAKKDKTAIAIYFYFGKRTTKLSAIIQIGFVYFKAFIFNELRNKYQIYLIDLKLDFYIKDLGISLIVEADNFYKLKLEKLIDLVLKDFIEYLKNINIEDLNETKLAFNKKVFKNNLTLNDWMNELILTAVLDGDINYANNLRNEVLKLTIDEIIFYYKYSLDIKHRKSYTIIVR